MNLAADNVDYVVDRGEVIAFGWSRIGTLQRLETGEMAKGSFNGGSEIGGEDREEASAGRTAEEKHFSPENFLRWSGDEMSPESVTRIHFSERGILKFFKKINFLLLFRLVKTQRLVPDALVCSPTIKP